jgi:hypothetical protein
MHVAMRTMRAGLLSLTLTGLAHGQARPPGDVVWSGMIRSRAATGKVVDVEGKSDESGADVVLWRATGRANQQWDLIRRFGDTYAIVSRNSGRVLEVDGAARDDGRPVQQWRWNGRSHQLWRLVSPGPGAREDEVVLVNAMSGKCLAIDDYAARDGARIVQFTCGRTGFDIWRLERRVGDTTALPTPGGAVGGGAIGGGATGGPGGGRGTPGRPDGIARATGAIHLADAPGSRVLDIEAARAADGTRVILFDANGRSNQRWEVIDVGRGEVAVFNARTGRVLDIGEGRGRPGAPVIVWRWHGGQNQRFRARPMAGGAVQLQSVVSGLCVAAPVTRTTTDQVVQWPCGERPDRWRLAR